MRYPYNAIKVQIEKIKTKFLKVLIIDRQMMAKRRPSISVQGSTRENPPGRTRSRQSLKYSYIAEREEISIASDFLIDQQEERTQRRKSKREIGR